MGIYNTYKEAVLANGSTNGVMFARNCLTGEEFFRSGIDFDYELQCPNLNGALWVECNPANYLESLEGFLASGKRLVCGDLIVSINGLVISVKQYSRDTLNTHKASDKERFILQAAADQMETPEEKEAFDAIDTTPKQVGSLSMLKWKPKSGQDVYIAQINTLAGVKEKRYYVHEYWCDSVHQNEYLNCGILLPTKEEAELKTKSMLGIPIETTEQREERERLEAAYDLYLTARSSTNDYTITFNQFCNSMVKSSFLAIVDKTGYRIQ